jgi:hypothetical protein
MELESCQNPAHTLNVFCSRTTIHTHTKRVLLTHNDSHTCVVCKYKTSFTNECILLQKQIQYVLHIVQTKIFRVQKKILQVHKTILQVRNTENCAWTGRHLRVDQQGGQFVAQLSVFRTCRIVLCTWRIFFCTWKILVCTWKILVCTMCKTYCICFWSKMH